MVFLPEVIFDHVGVQLIITQVEVICRVGHFKTRCSANYVD